MRTTILMLALAIAGCSHDHFISVSVDRACDLGLVDHLSIVAQSGGMTSKTATLAIDGTTWPQVFALQLPAALSGSVILTITAANRTNPVATQSTTATIGMSGTVPVTLTPTAGCNALAADLTSSMLDLVQPVDSSSPDFAALDFSIADIATPDTSPLADIAMPDTSPLLDFARPDSAVPDFAMPDLATPDLSTPNLTMPDLAMPDLTPAVARGNSLDYLVNDGSTSKTTSFDSGGAATGRYLLFVLQASLPSTDLITGVSYAGAPLALLGKRQKTNTARIAFDYFFGLADPATGTNNIVVSANAGMTFVFMEAIVYQGVKGSGQPNAIGQNARGDASGDFAVTVTPTVADAWIVAASSDNNGGIASAKGSKKISTTRAANGGYQAFDSDGPVGAAGPKTLTVTGPNGGGQDLYGIALAPL